LEPNERHLPATIKQAEVSADARALNVVPALIADLGDEAAWRYVEFFTANIRNSTLGEPTLEHAIGISPGATTAV
jgi:hypothetical protein